MLNSNTENSRESEPRKTLIIPMEIVERELNGYLLLVLEAVSRGWQCFIGTKKEIFTHMESLPKGIVFLKSLTTADIKITNALKEAGHIPVSQDVEGLIYTSMDEFATVRFHEDSVKNAAQIFFWGDVQREAVARFFPHHESRMIATGSPVADTWHQNMTPFYQERIDDIQKRFGKYILIPSSFGTANHFMGKRGNAKLMKREKFVNEAKEEEFYEFWEAYEGHLEKMFEAFLDILPELSRAFPEHEIIVRPHPSESHETWKEAAKNSDNVTVIFEGVVAPWLLGADAILHWGCTTGLEGYLMGKPVVAYNPATPEEDEKFEHKLPHSISIVKRTKAETLEALKEVVAAPDTVLQNYPEVVKGHQELGRWVMRMNDGKDSAARLMDEIEKLDIAPAAYKAFARKKDPLKERILQSVAAAFDLVRPTLKILPARIRHSIESRAYGRHKTRNIDPQVFENSARKLAAIKGKADVSTVKIHDNLFWVKPD